MKKQFLKWHNTFMWFGFVAILCWVVSGISHPLMAWFGPQAIKMFPPTLMVNDNDVIAVENIIRKYHLSHAVIAKVIPTANGPMLQVTEKLLSTDNANSNRTHPRRYFSLKDSNEIKDYDKQQAKWLAAYYTGIDVGKVTGIQMIQSFNDEYPRVNRLLPVYRVDIGEGIDSVATYIYTETNSLAAINNASKRRLQTVFQALHTWNWLDFTGHARVLLIALFMLTLLAMATTGLILVITLSHRKMNSQGRYWHRCLGYVLWLPLLAWAASGFYHLLQAQYVEPVSGIRLGKVMDLQQWLIKTTNNEKDWLNNVQSNMSGSRKLNAISLVQSHQENYYRLSVAPTQTMPVSRTKRFNGQASESNAIYICSRTGLACDHRDQDQALSLLQSLLGADVKYQSIDKVVRFGSGYDFRNKRLPVWKVDLVDNDNTRVFIDPVTGILVDQNRNIDRIESLSFSLLHKWNFLRAIMTRQWRDISIVGTLLACLLMSGLGLLHYFQRRQKLK